MKHITYFVGRAVRLLLSVAAAFAAGFFLFDWMVGTFDPLSALFVLGVGMGLTAMSLFMLLDRLTIVRREKR